MNRDAMQLKISYVNDVNTTYKVIEMGQDYDLIDYQVDMIRNNQVEGLLKVESRFVNNDLHLYYDVTSKQSLEDYMKRIQWGKKETLDFIEQLIGIVLRAETYLLDSSSFVIDASNIYIDPQTRKLTLVYLPVKMEQSINERIKAFFIQWIVYDASFIPNETDTILSQVLNALKNPYFNLKGFQQELGKMRLHQTPAKVDKPKQKPPKVEKKRPESLEKMIKESPAHQPAAVAPSKPKAMQSKMERTETTYKTKKRFKRSILLLAIVSQVLLCILLVLFAEKIISIAGGDSTSYIGLGMLVLVIEAFIFRKVFNIDSMEEVQIAEKQKKSKKKSKRIKKEKQNGNEAHQAAHDQRVVMNKKAIAPGPASVEYAKPVPQTIQRQAVNQHRFDGNETTLLQPSNEETLEETVLLSATPVKPYLSHLSSDGMERIDLTKDQFVIGRQQGIVDYAVQDNAVGRMHVEFINMDGQYYVKDLNSRNGTFVNEKRLLGEQQQQIQPGDVIKLANIDFTFNLDQ